MRFYSLMSIDAQFAECEIIGTKNSMKLYCPNCREPINRTQPEFISPIKIRFIPSSNRLGDFVYSVGQPYPIISTKVKEYFESMLYLCTFEEIEVVAPLKKRNTLQLPISDRLFLLRCSNEHELDLSRSSIPVEDKCNRCGKQKITWYNKEKAFVLGKQNGGPFVIRQLSDGAIYLSEQLIHKMTNIGFTNMAGLLEKGEIVDA